MSENFSIATESAGDTAILELSGEFDLAAVAQVHDVAAGALDGGGRALVLDLSSTTFIDSSGLNAIVELHKRARAAGLKVALACANPIVCRVLDLTAIDTVIPLFPSREEALQEVA